MSTGGESIKEKEPDNYDMGLRIIKGVIDYYNNSINFLQPIVYYRGEPRIILEEREHNKLARAREIRRLVNLEMTGVQI